MQPTVFIVDDDPSCVKSLSGQLENAGFLTKTFSFLETFFTFYRENIPGCLIIDIRATGNISIQLVSVLRKKNIHLAVIFLSEHPELQLAVQAIKLGALDFLEKNSDNGALIHSTQQALRYNQQQRWYQAEMYRVHNLYRTLTPREKEVMQGVLSGWINKKIAAHLEINLKTVEAHRANIMTKMQAHSLTELVTFAVRYQLIQEDVLSFAE